MKLSILTALISILLCSCIEIDLNLQINEDLSGNAELVYRVSTLAKELGDFEEDENFPLPLPVTRENFLARVEQVEGLSIESYQQQENEDNIIIQAVIRFNNPENLNALLTEEDKKITIDTNENLNSMEIRFINNMETEKSQKNMDIANAFFFDYNIKCSIVVPTAISSISSGTVTANRRGAQIEYTIPQLLESENAEIWRVEWQ